jgi:hypothetical protein
MMQEMLKDFGFVRATLRSKLGTRTECSDVIIPRMLDNTIQKPC